MTPTDQPTPAEPPVLVDTNQPTDVELYALRAYLKAGSARGAGERLGISEQTVKNHLASIRSKLGVHTTAQAVYLLHDRLAA